MGSKKRKKASKANRTAHDQVNQKDPGQATKAPLKNSRSWFVLTFILLFCFFCYSPSLENEFVNWDDGENFYENELITDLNDHNFWDLSKKIFTTDIIGGYNPLSIWTFLLENKFFGLENPFYWHLNNILLHLICCFFVFWIGKRMGLGLVGTSILTLLFAVHPMRVESVAWVTERKDVLFGAFYLAAMFYYIKGKQDGFRKREYLIIGICFLLSLFSKIQAVILPMSLILIDYYLSKDSKISIRSIVSKWPYLLASLAIGSLGILLLADEGSTELSYTGISRLFIGSYSLGIYYIKALVPFRLSPLYPYPSSLNWSFYISILVFLVSAYILWISYRDKKKVIFWGLAFFLVNIVLLLQILGAGHGYLADRFTYIPYLGLFFIVAYYLEQRIRSSLKYQPIILGLCLIVLVFYSIQCYNQNKIWYNSETMWTHVLKYYSDSDTPWANRAIHYRDNGQIEEALFDFDQYIKQDPDNSEAYNSKARLYFDFKERDSVLVALSLFDKAISLKNDDAEYYVNRGSTYAKIDSFDKALSDYNKAEEIDPNYPNLYINRSWLYNTDQKWNEALRDINIYLEHKPYDSGSWIEKARLHMILKNYDDWKASSDKAIAIQPNNGMYFYERARGFYYFKENEQSKASMNKALKLGYNRGNKSLIDKILNI